MRFEHKILLLSFAAGVGIWAVYSLVDAWIFFDGTFLDHLIRPVSIRDLHRRLFSTASFMAFGVLVSRLLTMRRKAMEATELAAEALQKSEKRYRLLAENISDVIWTGDLNTQKITYISPSVMQLLGYSVGEAKLLAKEELFTPASLPRALGIDLGEILNSVAQEGPGASPAIEIEMRRKDGTTVWTETRLTVLNDEAGQPIELICVTRDITERKQTERRLTQSEKMEAIGRLAGGVAHDFNNILTTIIGNLDLLKSDESITGVSERLIGEALGATGRASALTHQLLSFGRQPETAPEALNLNDVLKNMSSMLRRLIREDVTIETDMEKNISCIKADVIKMEQVIMNLAVNGRDAMPHGGKLTIETCSLVLKRKRQTSHGYVDPGPYVVLSVSDTGGGIAEDSISHIFEPFFTTKQMGRGTGLGLSTVYRIVEQSGGRLDVKSEIGRGTCFKIYFPAVGEKAAPTKQAVEVEERPESTDGHGETVLVVEDEIAVMDLIEHILTNAGYKVRTASTGGEAIAIASELSNAVDLLLTDVIMPEMQGEDLAQVIERSCPNIRTLFMSGYTEETIRHVAGLDEDIRFIGKPFTPDELLRKLRKTLDS